MVILEVLKRKPNKRLSVGTTAPDDTLIEARKNWMTIYVGYIQILNGMILRTLSE